jgi:KDO2-lipid IV(A) lauroyltransferase
VTDGVLRRRALAREGEDTAARERIVERLVERSFALGWATVAHAPEWFVRREFGAFADIGYLRDGRGTRQLRANLRRVVGPRPSGRELDQLARAALRSYLRYWREVFRLHTYAGDELIARMSVTDEKRLRDAWEAGRGMILALPHTGNWDQAGAWLTATGVPFTTVAERVQPAALFDQFVAFRERLGMEVIPLTGGQSPPYHLLADRLRAGGCLCLLADRDLTATGVPVDFFGEPARMPAGPAALALDTGAALLPVTLWYPNERDWAGRIHPAVEPPATGGRAAQVAAMTQHVADAFAEGIVAHPQDWHMFQRLWVADLDGEGFGGQRDRLSVPVIGS